jgi:hypothetical protein
MGRGDLNSSVSGRGTRDQAVSGGDLETAIVKVLANKLGLTVTQVQRLQELIGDRFAPEDKDARPRAAVRREEMAVIGRMKKMKSQKLTAAPTMADYNLLRDDVLQIFQALQSVATGQNDTFST